MGGLCCRTSALPIELEAAQEESTVPVPTADSFPEISRDFLQAHEAASGLPTTEPLTETSLENPQLELPVISRVSTNSSDSAAGIISNLQLGLEPTDNSEIVSEHTCNHMTIVSSPSSPGISTDSLDFEDITWGLLQNHYSSLCRFCEKLLRGEAKPDTFDHLSSHYLSLSCWLCQAMWEGSYETRLRPDLGKVSCLVEIKGDTPFSIVYSVSPQERSYIEDRQLSIRQSLTSDLGLNSRILSFLRSRLNACSKHPNCRKAVSFSVGSDMISWPARIIKILDDRVRVIPFDADKMIGQYASLSYCWGPPSELAKNPPYKMTSSTMKDLQSEFGVSVQQMPLTIQQALMLCKLLGIEYIWIDSLCIL